MKLLPFGPTSLPTDPQFLAAHQRVLLIAGAAFLAVVALWLLFIPRGRSRVVARLGSLVWKRNQFCRGWLITGDTGSGKTSSGINQIAHQVFQNEPCWGGLPSLCEERPGCAASLGGV